MDFSTPITRTKLLIPRRRENLLRRGRLLKALQDSAERRLTIVAAPAGYGKTSLLADFASETMMPVCWYSIDELDTDPHQFLFHFVASINERFPGFAKTSYPAMQAMLETRVTVDTIVALLVNDIYENITEHFVVIIDDYHIIERSADVNYFINRFLMKVDENCHLIISSRKLLPLADMPLLVARAAVGGVGFEDLAFSQEEIQKLYAQNFNLEIKSNDAQKLVDEYEGWITGLLLSTEVVEGKIQERVQSRIVTGVSLYDYLAQQVLQAQPENRQFFLFTSSLLNEFNAELCQQVIGDALKINRDWQEDIDYVLRNNLFAFVIGEDKPLIRYHHLFREFLQSTIQKNDPMIARRIQTNYVQHLKSIGEWERAYLLTKKMGSPDLSAELIENIGQQMIINGKFKVIKQWLEELPEIYRKKSPVLNAIYGASVLMGTDKRIGIEILTDSIEALTASGDIDNLTLALIRRTYGWRQLGQYEKSLEDLNRAIDLMEEKDLTTTNLASAYHAKGATLLLMGRSLQSVEWIGKGIELYKKLGYDVGANKALLDYGLALNSIGSFAESEASYLTALKYSERTGNVIWQSSVLNNLGVLHATLGEYETAIPELESSIQYSRIGDFYRAEAYALSSIGDIFLDVGLVEEAKEAYKRAYHVESQFQDHFLHFYLYFADAQIHYFKGENKRSLESIQIASKLAAESNSAAEAVLAKFLKGWALIVAEDFDNAKVVMQEAYQLAGIQRMIPEEARCLLPLYVTELLSKDYTAALVTQSVLDRKLDQQIMIPNYARYGEMIKRLLERAELPDSMEPFAERLVEVIDQVRVSIVSVRRSLRAKSKIVKLSPAQFNVRMLGRSQVKIGDHVITGAEWMSQNARDLLFLLILHPEGLTKEQIGTIFWPDLSPEELKLRFKNTIYRLRRAAGKEVIQFRDDIYQFNYDMDYEADYETFDRMLTLSRKSTIPDEKIKYLAQAIQVYRGDFLPDIFDDWVIPIRDDLQSRYMNALRELTELHLELGNHDRAIQTGATALKENPLFEPVVGPMMKSFIALGDLPKAIEFYQQYKDNLNRTYSVQPSLELARLYQELMPKS